MEMNHTSEINKAHLLLFQSSLIFFEFLFYFLSTDFVRLSLSLSRVLSSLLPVSFCFGVDLRANSAWDPNLLMANDDSVGFEICPITFGCYSIMGSVIKSRCFFS